MVARSWAAALRGLPMFHWHPPFATWVAGITVARARTQAADDRGGAHLRPAPSPAPQEPAPGPADWSDLPGGRRWGHAHAHATAAAALAALPLTQREVVHTRDIERWPPRRVCDVLGLPEVAYQQALADGREALRDALGRLVGEPPGSPQQAAQTAAVVRMLGTWLTGDDVEPLDARVVAVFTRWRASRRPGWRRLSEHLTYLPHLSRSA